MNATTATSTDSQRKRQIAAIHVLKAKARLDDETYRAMLMVVGGSSSSSTLSAIGRLRVLDHLRQLVDGPGAPAGSRSYPGRPHNTDITPLLTKIEALLTDGGKPWNYGLAICRRVAKKNRFEFCTEDELRKVVAALSYDQKRRRNHQPQPEASPC